MERIKKEALKEQQMLMQPRDWKIMRPHNWSEMDLLQQAHWMQEQGFLPPTVTIEKKK